MVSLPFIIVGCVTLVIVIALLVGSSISKHAVSTRASVERYQAENDLRQAELDTPPIKDNPAQQALTVLLERRKELENQISQLRSNASSSHYVDKSYTSFRETAITALKDARAEQAELIAEQAKLLAMMRGNNDEHKVDTAQEPVRVAAGGPVAQRVDDPDLLHDAEPDEQETSREGTA